MQVEFHFDFGSPNAYLAHRVIPAIEARTRRTVSLCAGAAGRGVQGDRQQVSSGSLRGHPQQAGLRTTGDASGL